MKSFWFLLKFSHSLYNNDSVIKTTGDIEVQLFNLIAVLITLDRKNCLSVFGHFFGWGLGPITRCKVEVLGPITRWKRRLWSHSLK